MFLEKGPICLQNPAISHYSISCNISLYRDTEEMIYRYTENVYHCISNTYTYIEEELEGKDLYSNTGKANYVDLSLSMTMLSMMTLLLCLFLLTTFLNFCIIFLISSIPVLVQIKDFDSLHQYSLVKTHEPTPVSIAYLLWCTLFLTKPIN